VQWGYAVTKIKRPLSYEDSGHSASQSWMQDLPTHWPGLTLKKGTPNSGVTWGERGTQFQQAPNHYGGA